MTNKEEQGMNESDVCIDKSTIQFCLTFFLLPNSEIVSYLHVLLWARAGILRKQEPRTSAVVTYTLAVCLACHKGQEVLYRVAVNLRFVIPLAGHLACSYSIFVIGQ